MGVRQSIAGGQTSLERSPLALALGDGLLERQLFDDLVPVSSVQSSAEAKAAPTSPRLQIGSAAQGREEPRTSFERLRAAEVAALAGEAFPSIIERETRRPPPPSGQSVGGYLTPNGAQLALPRGKHVVVKFTQPTATENPAGQLAPVDVGLSEAGDVFASAWPVAGTIIPKCLSVGMQPPERGVSLTPVDSSGTPHSYFVVGMNAGRHHSTAPIALSSAGRLSWCWQGLPARTAVKYDPGSRG